MGRKRPFIGQRVHLGFDMGDDAFGCGGGHHQVSEAVLARYVVAKPGGELGAAHDEGRRGVL